MVATSTSTTHRDALYARFQDQIRLNPDLNRRLVSYQADKETPFYRWFKYREGFTSQLVQYLLAELHPDSGMLLDPFAGSGAALFAATAVGWKTIGVEVLPVGVHAIKARIASEKVDRDLFARVVRELRGRDFANDYDEAFALKHIPITRGAFSEETERQLVGYIAYCNKHITDDYVKQLALYASFCILEEISFTRKDGQYLRWDYRSGRSQGKTGRQFDKGSILAFDVAIRSKLLTMAEDLGKAQTVQAHTQLQFVFENAIADEFSHLGPVPQIKQGTCLEILPTIPALTIDTIFTSPPYCNRYDYTRTYALELVYLEGANFDDVNRLRQTMLSCTVENKTKSRQLEAYYRNLGRSDDFQLIENTFNSLDALQEVLDILEDLKARQELNNPNIANLVRNYFYEMCFVIHEMSRLLTQGGHVIMVNDNVRYAGEEVPVDLILSSMAESFGLVLDRIWVLPIGKGNSSQQMGEHGRSELRKCVYVWVKE